MKPTNIWINFLSEDIYVYIISSLDLKFFLLIYIETRNRFDFIVFNKEYSISILFYSIFNTFLNLNIVVKVSIKIINFVVHTFDSLKSIFIAHV